MNYKYLLFCFLLIFFSKFSYSWEGVYSTENNDKYFIKYSEIVIEETIASYQTLIIHSVKKENIKVTGTIRTVDCNYMVSKIQNTTYYSDKLASDKIREEGGSNESWKEEKENSPFFKINQLVCNYLYSNIMKN